MPKRAESKSSTLASPALPPRLTAVAFVLLRLFVGIQLLVAGAHKWNWIGTHRLAHQLIQWTRPEHPAALEGYVHFLTTTVLPHASLFTYLVVCGELGVGLLLTLGLLTRLAALLGLCMNANYLLATWAVGAASQGMNEAFLVMELALLLVGAGRVYGLDVRLARKRPRSPLW